MSLKHILAVSAAAVAMIAGGASLAGDNDIMVTGDKPMNVGQTKQLEAPDPNAAEQAHTEKMLKQQSEELSGDLPVDQGDEKQIKNPIK